VVPIEEYRSKRYRVDNLRAQLRLDGIASEAIWNIDLARRLDFALSSDVIVFHRTPATPELKSFAAAARGRGIPLAFEIDDYLFDPSVLPTIPGLDEASPEIVARMSSQVAGCAEMLQLCDAFIGSTHFLARRAEELGQRAFVIRNGLSDRHLTLAQAALDGRERVERQAAIRVGYMSGTHTHREDFAVVVPALRRILNEFPRVILVLRGLLDVPAPLLGYMHRIERRPYVSWQRLVAATAALDIAIAPLALDNPFTEGKSALKYFESAIVRVPVVASPSEEFRLSIRHGDNGLLASSDEEWYEGLRALVADDAVRSRMGSSARADALAHYTIDAQSPGTVQVFRDLLAPIPVLSRQAGAPS
jgi:glycosyltransferase involved in cell wall biosynthesis